MWVAPSLFEKGTKTPFSGGGGPPTDEQHVPNSMQRCQATLGLGATFGCTLAIWILCLPFFNLAARNDGAQFESVWSLRFWLDPPKSNFGVPFGLRLKPPKKKGGTLRNRHTHQPSRGTLKKQRMTVRTALWSELTKR